MVDVCKVLQFSVALSFHHIKERHWKERNWEILPYQTSPKWIRAIATEFLNHQEFRERFSFLWYDYAMICYGMVWYLWYDMVLLIWYGNYDMTWCGMVWSFYDTNYDNYDTIFFFIFFSAFIHRRGSVCELWPFLIPPPLGQPHSVLIWYDMIWYDMINWYKFWYKLPIEKLGHCQPKIMLSNFIHWGHCVGVWLW